MAQPEPLPQFMWEHLRRNGFINSGTVLRTILVSRHVKDIFISRDDNTIRLHSLICSNGNCGLDSKLFAKCERLSLPGLQVLDVVCGWPNKASAGWVAHFLHEARLQPLTDLRIFSISLDDHCSWNEQNIVYVPEIDARDVILTMRTAKKLSHLLVDTTTQRGVGRIHVASPSRRVDMLCAIEEVLTRVCKVCLDLEFKPPLSPAERLRIRMSLPHHCTGANRSDQSQRGRDRALRIQWGYDEDREITPALVPDTYNKPWSMLTGKTIFLHQFSGQQWRDLNSTQQGYFTNWATKCRNYQSIPLDVDEVTDANFSGEPQWIVKHAGGRDSIGLLSMHGRDQVVRWLPEEGEIEEGSTQVVNWLKMGLGAADVIQNLNVCKLLVPFT